MIYFTLIHDHMMCRVVPGICLHDSPVGFTDIVFIMISSLYIFFRRRRIHSP